MTRGKKILVINPNSNQQVTRHLAEALKPLMFENSPEIECVTLAEGPFGVESQADVESVTMPLRRLVAADNSADAFVIACYSDPGLHVAKRRGVRYLASPRPAYSQHWRGAIASASSLSGNVQSTGTCATCVRCA
jgi:hypothetical protein